MAKAGVQGTSDAGAVLGRKSKRKGREGRRQAKTAAASGGRLPARPEDPLEVWWWLPGPVLAPSRHLTLRLRAQRAAASHSWGRRGGTCSTARGRSLLWGGRDDRGRREGHFRGELPSSVTPPPSGPRLLEGLAPSSGSPRLPWNVLTSAQRLSQPHPPFKVPPKSHLLVEILLLITIVSYY